MPADFPCIWLLLILAAAVAVLVWLLVVIAKRPKRAEDFTGAADFDSFAELDVVGESFYQTNLEHLAGGRSEEGADLTVEAQLAPRSDLPEHPTAVGVYVRGLLVGHLSSSSARMYRKRFGTRPSSAPAVIVGGWDRGSGDVGHFGIRLEP